MKPFRFRLARVLRVRRLQEEVARGELLVAHAAARAARTAADEAAAELGRGEGELAELLARPRLEPAGVVLRHACQDIVRRACEARGQRAREREREAELRRAAALEARTVVRGLERLEERRRVAHAAEQQHSERAAQDETLQQRSTAGAPGPGSSPARPTADERPGPSRPCSTPGPFPIDPQ